MLYLEHGLFAQEAVVSTNDYYACLIEKEMRSLGFETLAFENPEHTAYINLRMIKRGEQATSLSLREYRVPNGMDAFDFFKQNIVWTYSGGIPPQNHTYNIGDLVLSRTDFTNNTNQTGFIVFSKDAIINCTLNIKDGNVKPYVVALTDVLRVILPPTGLLPTEEIPTTAVPETQHPNAKPKSAEKQPAHPEAKQPADTAPLSLPVSVDPEVRAVMASKDGTNGARQSNLWIYFGVGVLLGVCVIAYLIRKKRVK